MGYSPWGHKESEMTEYTHATEMNNNHGFLRLRH